MDSAEVALTGRDEYDDLEFDFPLDQLDLGSAQFASQIPLPPDSRKRSGAIGDTDQDEVDIDFLNDILEPSLPLAELARPPESLDDLALIASPTKSTTSTSAHPPAGSETDQEDIEDISNMIERVAPFYAFRKKGFFSVSDLVGPLWCEVQYDYRLRTLPFLPVDQRPTEIISNTGKTIKVDKKVVENHEKVMRKGNVVHKQLEREIHPEEVKVTTTTREDVWGLRFLNMLSSLEALMTLGKCRELPVVGFIKEYMVVGVIDEIVRMPVPESVATTPSSTNKGRQQSSVETTMPQPKQTVLTKFLIPMPSSNPPKPKPSIRTHKLFVSDSKTRASGTMPREENTQSGQLQLMLYKELLDGLLLAGPSTSPAQVDVDAVSTHSILPSSTPFSFVRLFDHLGLDPALPFSSTFLRESRAVVKGNRLGNGAEKAACLADMVKCWTASVERLSLGPAPRSEPFLELVYRHTGRSKMPKADSRLSKKRRKLKDQEQRSMPLSQASNASAEAQYWTGNKPRTQSEEREESELAAAIEMSLAMPQGSLPAAGAPPAAEQSSSPASYVQASIESHSTAPKRSVSPAIPSAGLPEAHANVQDGASPLPATPAPRRSKRLAPAPDTITQPSQTAAEVESDANSELKSSADTIIGKHRFRHSPDKLAAHLNSVLAFWTGERPPIGVTVEHTTRCGWCEFEDGCEWRAAKAEEAVAAARARAAQRAA